jgi:phosphotransferase system enzyme I (PtsI)
MAGRRITARAAAPGLAAGEVVTLWHARPAREGTEGVIEEADALLDAVQAAAQAVAVLMQEHEGEAADMLAFQHAMLEDEELWHPSLERIQEGEQAEVAWTEAMDAEIASYRASEDEYFRARASDLVDIKERVLDHLCGSSAPKPPPGAILMAEDVTPSQFLANDWQGGALLLTEGSPTSHVAMLARARGVPMIVGLKMPLIAGTQVLVDGAAGTIIVNPDEADLVRFERQRQAAAIAAAGAESFRDQPAVTADGTAIAVLLNIAAASELEGLDPACCDGIGLVRTELLFEGATLPDEETQRSAYEAILRWAAGRPVTIRTLDAGGDKPIPGLTPEGESNPFLGVRGVRLTLRHRDVFRTQLRALCRAAVAGPLEIMIPMVAVPAEMTACADLLDEVVAALAAEGLPHRRPPLGMMVEVPAAAVAVDLFPAEFFSIGSNDLTQYVMAAGRDIGAVAELADPGNEAVLRLIAGVARHGAATGRKVSLCGDAGGDPALIPALLARGLRSLSMAPRLVGPAKAAIAGVRLDLKAARAHG